MANKKTDLKSAAGTRVTRVVNALSAVANLNRYKPTKTQVDAIMKALRDVLDMTEKQLRKAPGQKETLFKLPD